MKGKDKCNILKDIRRRIAEENDIAFVTSNCEFKGECKGTCPKCEAEVRYLEQELEKRRRLGKSIALTALSATMLLSAAGCYDPVEKEELFTETEGEAPIESVEVEPGDTEEIIELEGDVYYVPEDEDDETLMGEPTEEEVEELTGAPAEEEAAEQQEDEG